MVDVEKYDNHQLQTARACPLKWHFRHNLGLVQGGGSYLNPALEYGVYMHKALDYLWEHKEILGALDIWTKEYTPVLAQYDPMDPTVDKHSLQVGGDMLTSYWSYWKESIEAMELLACEQYFAIDLEMNEERSECPDCQNLVDMPDVKVQNPDCVYCHGTGYYYGPFYCGVVDKVFIDHRSGQVVGMDHKTTSMLTGALISAFKISQQFRGYVFFLKRHSKWADRCGEYFYFDMLLKKRTKYNADNMPFYRDTVLAQDPFLDEWEDDMRRHVREVQRMREEYNNQHLTPRQNGDNCNSFNRLCQYYDLCSLPREMRDTTLEQLYDIDHWDPLERA
jgi:hypothetical protein